MGLGLIIADQTVVTCARDTAVEEIASLMEDHDVGAVVVLEAGKPLGMITDRDLALRCLSKGEAGLKMNAEALMSTPAETVSEEAGIYELIERMSQRQIRRVCVVDQAGQCKAIVSLGDLMQLLAREFGKLVEASAPDSGKLMQEAKSA